MGKASFLVQVISRASIRTLLRFSERIFGRVNHRRTTTFRIVSTEPVGPLSFCLREPSTHFTVRRRDVDITSRRRVSKFILDVHHRRCQPRLQASQGRLNRGALLSVFLFRGHHRFPYAHEVSTTAISVSSHLRFAWVLVPVGTRNRSPLTGLWRSLLSGVCHFLGTFSGWP